MKKLNYKDWMKKHYPVPAQEMKTSSWKDCLDHSLTKWKGLRQKTLAKYNLFFGHASCRIHSNESGSPEILDIDATTCALCVKAATKTTLMECQNCPLYKARGNCRCDETMRGERMSPFMVFLEESNPAPMIKWLTKSKDFVE